MSDYPKLLLDDMANVWNRKQVVHGRVATTAATINGSTPANVLVLPIKVIHQGFHLLPPSLKYPQPWQPLEGVRPFAYVTALILMQS